MKLFSCGKDGGDKSTVWGFWLVEIKSLFSVVVLCFEKGSRESFHSHAFNAVTWFLKGNIDEQHLDGRVINWTPSLKPKYTPRRTFHKVFATERTWAISFRGPWASTWKEFRPRTKQFVTLTNKRKIVKVECLKK